MKRKRDHGKGQPNKENESPHQNENIKMKTSTAGNESDQRWCQTPRLQRENLTVPVQSIFSRLSEGIYKSPATTSIGPIDEPISNTPKTPRNKRKTFLGIWSTLIMINYEQF